jgi:hypothetical protein
MILLLHNCFLFVKRLEILNIPQLRKNYCPENSVIHDVEVLSMRNHSR